MVNIWMIMWTYVLIHVYLQWVMIELSCVENYAVLNGWCCDNVFINFWDYIFYYCLVFFFYDDIYLTWEDLYVLYVFSDLEKNTVVSDVRNDIYIKGQ
jgi:hypothetical protein